MTRAVFGRNTPIQSPQLLLLIRGLFLIVDSAEKMCLASNQKECQRQSAGHNGPALRFINGLIRHLIDPHDPSTNASDAISADTHEKRVKKEQNNAI